MIEKALILLWFWFKVGVLLTFIVFPSLALYGEIDPWSADQELLRNEFGEYRPFLTGVSASLHNYDAWHQRSYLLIPTNSDSPKLVSITYHNDLLATHEESTVSFFLILLLWTLSGIGSWYFWIKTPQVE